MGRSSEAKSHKTPKKVERDRWTDRPTKRGVELRSTRIKTTLYYNIYVGVFTDEARMKLMKERNHNQTIEAVWQEQLYENCSSMLTVTKLRMEILNG